MAADDLLARLRVTADHLASLHDAVTAEAGRRNGLIAELRDQDVTWATVAAAARLSVTRCHDIVAQGVAVADLGPPGRIPLACAK